MFENKDSNNISKKALAFIGIFTLIAAVTGATLAFLVLIMFKATVQRIQ